MRRVRALPVRGHQGRLVALHQRHAAVGDHELERARGHVRGGAGVGGVLVVAGLSWAARMVSDDPTWGRLWKPSGDLPWDPAWDPPWEPRILL